MQHTTSHKR